jgi:tRNA (guanine37-N1)-methyltransferase
MKLKAALQDIFSEDELNLLVRGYDVVGDIAITIIPPELEYRQTVIGEAILASNKNIRVVAKRVGVYSGEYRTIPLTIIAGEDRKDTLHKDFGVRLHLNPELVYFSVRSGSERKRVADLTGDNENILVMFSGVAPYPLVLARFNPSCRITGIETNRAAHDFGIRNVEVNKVQKQVQLHHGGVEEVLPQLGQRFDRIIMPLPKSSARFLPLALARLQERGWLHFYDFQSPSRYSESVKKVEACCKEIGRTLLSGEVFVCGHSGPDTYRICIDAHIL